MATFADSVGTNTATLTAPSWTVETHRLQRRSLRADQTTAGYNATHTKEGGGGSGCIEVSNGGPAIPMIAAYQNATASFVIWTCPLGEFRGRQHWDTTASGFGSEIVAGAFSVASPAAGHWLIERVWVGSGWSTTNWYWTFSVYDGTSWSSRIGLNDANAIAAIDVAHRLVATFGAAGAQLWVDDTLIGTVTSYTGGWASLSEPITLGCDPDFDHANARRPYWGRIDDVRVYSGQMGSSDVTALPAAVSSLLWKYPSDFDDTTAIKMSDQSGSTPCQDAVDAAGTAGVYVWQEETDTAEYGDPYGAAGGDIGTSMPDDCKGLVGCKWTRPAHPTTISNWDRWIAFWDTSIPGGLLTKAWNGKLVGCIFDANAFESGYRIDGDPPNGNDIQQAHITVYNSSGAFTITVDIDACTFQDCTSDAVSMYEGFRGTVQSCRFKSNFRGHIVQNEMNNQCTVLRCELSEFGPHDRNGGGIDFEPFGDPPDGHEFITFRDVWITSDFDNSSRGPLTEIKFYNTHFMAGGLYWELDGIGSNLPLESVHHYYCSVCYHKTGGPSSSLRPPSRIVWLPTDDGLGAYFEGTVFVASGLSFRYHEYGITTPPNDERYHIDFSTNGTGRLITCLNCELRAREPPAGISTANMDFFDLSGFTTGESIELDGFTIGPEFADTPFDLGGVTIRHRNVLHERTSSTTPWINAGATVAI